MPPCCVVPKALQDRKVHKERPVLLDSKVPRERQGLPVRKDRKVKKAKRETKVTPAPQDHKDRKAKPGQRAHRGNREREVRKVLKGRLGQPVPKAPKEIPECRRMNNGLTMGIRGRSTISWHTS